MATKKGVVPEIDGPVHRSLQDRFETRRLADNVETRGILTEIPQEHKAFIESRDMFFLSTIDHQGRPPSPTRAAIQDSFASSTARPSRFPAMTATACSIRWVTCLVTPKWACCSSISKSHTGCAFRASRTSMTTIRCCKNTPRRSW